MSGTSMAAPTVTGAVALYKSSRPNATPAEVREALRYLGNLNWKTSTDPDSTHEPLLDVSRIGPLGTFTLSRRLRRRRTSRHGTTASVPFTVGRSSTFFERVRLSITSVPDWLDRRRSRRRASWAGPATRRASRHGPDRHATGRLPDRRPGDQPGPDSRRRRSPSTSCRICRPPRHRVAPGRPRGSGGHDDRAGPGRWPAATDPTSGIAGYELQVQRGTGAWGGTVTADRRPA